MDLRLNKNLSIDVIVNGKLAKSTDIDKESYGKYMRELASDRVDMIRTCHKLLKIKSTTFKGVKI